MIPRSSPSPSGLVGRYNKQQQQRIIALAAVAVVLFVVLVLGLARGGPIGGGSTRKDSLGSKSRARTLVMVPGHGVFVNGTWDVEKWMTRFIPDIEKQISLAMTKYASDPSALVVFSGGWTHLSAGKVSEGETYIQAAKQLGFANYRDAQAEEYAMDSFENALFSICRFKEITGSYPERYVVVGFEFKRERFVNEHRKAMRFPRNKFEYIGVPEPTIQTPIQEQIDMERRGTISQFHADPYGCKPPLSTKKQDRNIFHRTHSYQSTCPEMAGLLNACGPQVYRGPLPWD